MLTRAEPKQVKIMFITIEDLVPQDHFLRQLDAAIDFSFIYEKVSHLYSENGRPGIDPVILIKSLLIGYIYGINSERRIEQELQVNMAYKWFLGLNIDENPPDHSTMSQNRRRRFSGTNIFREIFEEIVLKCYESGLIDGKTLFTDSTHVKANATSSKYQVKDIQRELGSYITELDALADEEIKKLKERGAAVRSPKRKTGKKVQKRTSLTDPDSGELNRPGKPMGFHYLSHQTCDSKHGIIVDVEVTGGDSSDSLIYHDRMSYIKKRFGFKTTTAGADAGYSKAITHYLLFKEGIDLYAPHIKKQGILKAKITRADMTYNEDRDCFICPNSKQLLYKNIDRSEYGEVYKVYRTSTKDCTGCTFNSDCIVPSKKHKVISVNVLEPFIVRGRQLAESERFKSIMKGRQILAEGNNALQKEHHNLKRTKKRGLLNALEHCLFSAMALNLKCLVKYS